LDILIYIENATGDEDLHFCENFLPETLASALQKIHDSPVIFYSAPESYSGRLTGNKNCFLRKGKDDVEFWKDIFSKTGSDHLCKIHAGSSFLDVSIIQEMIDLHMKYLAEFTFSENLPPGFSCEVVAKELIASIPDFNEQTLPLNQVVRSNINQFDIELYYKDPDIRDKRISFLASNRRDKRIMENIYSLHKKIPLYRDIKGVIETNPEVVYTGPSYLEIELTGECDLDCLFCYRTTLKQVHGTMDAGLLQQIIGQMKFFNLPYSVCFGGSGEPMMHPKFYELLTLVQNDPLIETVIVETNGLYADVNYRNFIENTGSKIKTIVNMNGINAETYQKLHGKDFFDRVRENILSLNETAGDRLYLQIMKIKETEPFLDAYYDLWEKQKISIILQKQNTYLGRTQDRRYSDLTPLERIPCWHLQRDLYILSDGTVSFCKQDVDGTWSCGSCASETVSSIWEKKKKSFISDYKKNLATEPDCKSCDEWYTFNC
jgi:spiro-SPASM protein